MTPQDALSELLARVGAAGGAAVFVSADELSQWPTAAVAAMKVRKLLSRASPAVSVVCPGCEQACIMPVHVAPGPRGPASFIVCDKRSDINRVSVSNERQTQWRCEGEALCGFIAASLGLRRSNQHSAAAGVLNIGIASGDRRHQMLCLRTDGDLALVAGNSTVPLAELIGFHDGNFSVDGAAIRQLVDSATTADPRYTPRNARRETRKLDTQAMYEGWRKACRDWKKKRPNMSDVWYSQQIAKMEIANGRSADTIRKRMKH